MVASLLNMFLLCLTAARRQQAAAQGEKTILLCSRLFLCTVYGLTAVVQNLSPIARSKKEEGVCNPRGYKRFQHLDFTLYLSSFEFLGRAVELDERIYFLPICQSNVQLRPENDGVRNTNACFCFIVLRIFAQFS